MVNLTETTFTLSFESSFHGEFGEVLTKLGFQRLLILFYRTSII
jgi:hypothetical protein